MIKRLHKRKEYIVILLLTGFISVFVCDALCDFGVISWGNYSAVVNKTDTHPKKAHDHDHHDTNTDHHHDNKHSHDGNEEDECCDEVVNNLYASLIKYELKQIPVETPVFHVLYQVYAVDFETENFNQQLLPFLYTNLPPPLSGNHIRIFIQSFLN
ncbi:MAG TPA: hypothetical protein PKL31_00795 [Fulvivirga sp.]|nr:hypothetical protein [Fulvivirga sp.]